MCSQLPPRVSLPLVRSPLLSLCLTGACCLSLKVPDALLSLYGTGLLCPVEFLCVTLVPLSLNSLLELIGSSPLRDFDVFSFPPCTQRFHESLNLSTTQWPQKWPT